MSIERARPYLWALGILWVLPALVTLAGHLLLDRVVHVPCDGDGLACVFSDRDGFFLLMSLAGAWLFWAGPAACAVIAYIRHQGRKQS